MPVHAEPAQNGSSCRKCRGEDGEMVVQVRCRGLRGSHGGIREGKFCRLANFGGELPMNTPAGCWGSYRKPLLVNTAVTKSEIPKFRI